MSKEQAAYRTHANSLASRRSRWLPAWLLHYRRDLAVWDGIAGLVVTVLRVPQSLAQGHTAVELLLSLLARFQKRQPAASALGLSAVLAWWSSRRVHASLLTRGGLRPHAAELLAKLLPMVSVLLDIGAVAVWRLDNARGVAVVGSIAQGLPMLKQAWAKREPANSLLLPTFMVAMPGFVESVTVAQLPAIKRGQHRPQRRTVWAGPGQAGERSVGR